MKIFGLLVALALGLALACFGSTQQDTAMGWGRWLVPRYAPTCRGSCWWTRWP